VNLLYTIKLDEKELVFGWYYTFVTISLTIVGEFLGIKCSATDNSVYLYVRHDHIGEISINVEDITSVH